MLKCSHCQAPLRAGVIGLAEFVSCHQCGSKIAADVFPAVARDPGAGSAASAPAASEEAGCFYHPQKRAVVTCEGCGRFLCSLCDVEMHDQHLCPSCLSSGRKKGRLRNLENERVLYGNIALALAVIPVITVWFTIFTAPAALYIAFRYWNAPPSLVSGARWKLVLAAILAFAQVAGWIALVIYLFTK